MINEYVHFVNNSQPAINEDNLNLMQQLIKQDINGAVSGDTLPIGAFMPYAGAVAPTNWLICDGSAVSRTTYRDLFNILGTTFGAGDGSTTFNLPDLRGKVPVGVDSNDTDFNAIGKTYGEKSHTMTINEMPSHTHLYKYGTNTGNTEGSLALANQVSGTISGDYGNAIQNTGDTQPFSVMQPSMATNYIIKAFQTAGVVAQVVNEHSESTTDVYSASYVNGISDYSTTEKVCGTWIDGKPLYAVTINCGELYNNARKEISTSTIIPTTARCVHIEGDCTRYSSGLHDTVPLFTRVTLALYRSEQQKILLDTDSDQTSWTAIVTLFYTKTTD